MRTNRPSLGTAFVLLLSLLLAAASAGASAKPDRLHLAAASFGGKAGIAAQARSAPENEWIECEGLQGGNDAPDDSAPGSPSSALFLADAKRPAKTAPSHAPTHETLRQTPPATGPPSA
jgi:hypothetical protein